MIGNSYTININQNIKLLLIFSSLFIAAYIFLFTIKSSSERFEILSNFKYKNELEQTNHPPLYSLSDIVEQNWDVLPSRKSNLTARELCKKRNTCVSRYRRFGTKLQVSETYKIVNCINPKVMSNFMREVMCFLNDEITSTIKNFNDKYRLCNKSNVFSNLEEIRNEFNISFVNTEWNFSMVTEDPIDRFISNYIENCVSIHSNLTDRCYGCKQNMTCFIIMEYNNLMNISRNVDVEKTAENVFFFPQLWYCDLQNEFEFFEFLRFSLKTKDILIPQLDDLLQRQNVPFETRQIIRQKLIKNNIDFSYSGSTVERFYHSRLTESPYLLEFIVRMFYNDFNFLHYDLPEGF